ncbi:hypothetical protein AB6N24_06230 [Cellulomonas sp. 179-A 4D5 NHS]|uniref:hypothetical protein n=1 Tax=Cellulomonas sp. 179-A 4D5 NHS TaxID=3142378 RepID=UPI00399F36E8
MRFLTQLTLVGLLPSPAARDEVLGDLAEAEAHHREEHGPLRASVWYHAEAARTSTQLIIRGMTAHPRAVVISLVAGALVTLAVYASGTVLAIATMVGWPWGVSLGSGGLVPVVATAVVLAAVAGGTASALVARHAPLVPVAWLAILAALSSPLLERVTVALASAPELVGWPAALLPSSATTTLTLAIALPVAILLGGLGVHLFLEAPHEPGTLPATFSRLPMHRLGVGVSVVAVLLLSALLAIALSRDFGGWTGGGFTMLALALALATTGVALLAYHRRSTLRRQLDLSR